MKEVPASVVDALSANGAIINGDTMLEVLQLENIEDKAICITNVIDGDIQKDVFIQYE